MQRENRTILEGAGSVNVLTPCRPRHLLIVVLAARRKALKKYVSGYMVTLLFCGFFLTLRVSVSRKVAAGGQVFNFVARQLNFRLPTFPHLYPPAAAAAARTSPKRDLQIVDDLSEERHVRARQIADLQRRADRAESLAAQGAIIRASERLAGAKQDAELEERAVKAHRHAEELAEKVCMCHLYSSGPPFVLSTGGAGDSEVPLNQHLGVVWALFLPDRYVAVLPLLRAPCFTAFDWSGCCVCVGQQA